MKLKVLLASTLFLLICQTVAFADGAYIPKYYPRTDPRSHQRDIIEPEQKAVILHFNSKERLILQVSYKGDVSEFAWLVPTPAVPKISKFDQPIFHELQRRTAPLVKYWFDADLRLQVDRSRVMLSKSASSPNPTLQVDVVERKTVGFYDIAVLRARDENDLLKWLKTNGYQIRNELKDVLKYYIQRGWVFTASRIDTSKQQSVGDRLKEGVLQSIQFDFKSPEPVYPLRISSLNPGRTEVLIYTFADHRLGNSIMETKCGRMRSLSVWQTHLVSVRYRWPSQVLDKTEVIPSAHSLKPVSSSSLFDGLVNVELDRYRPVYMTKLSSDLTPKQMDHDITLKRATDDEAIPPNPVSPPVLENLGATCLLFITLFTGESMLIWIWFVGFCMLLINKEKLRRSISAWLIAAVVFSIAISSNIPHSYYVAPFVYQSLYQSVGIKAVLLIAIVIMRIALKLFASGWVKRCPEAS